MFTEYKDDHCQRHCDKPLETLEDYSGGGSHYWVLLCNECGAKFMFDTYRFKLEPYGM